MGFPVFNIETGQKRPFWTAFNLLPNSEDYGDAKGREYYYKVIIGRLTGSLHEFQKLYEQEPFDQVLEFYAVQQAINFVPPQSEGN